MHLRCCCQETSLKGNAPAMMYSYRHTLVVQLLQLEVLFLTQMFPKAVVIHQEYHRPN